MPEENNSKPTLTLHDFTLYLISFLKMQEIIWIPLSKESDFHKKLVTAFNNEKEQLEKYYRIGFRLQLHPVYGESDHVHEILMRIINQGYGYASYPYDGCLHLKCLDHEAHAFTKNLPDEVRKSFKKIVYETMKEFRV